MCNNPCKYNKDNICNKFNNVFKGLSTINYDICKGCGGYEPKYQKEQCTWFRKDDVNNIDACGLCMPDSLYECKGLCEHFTIETSPCHFEQPLKEDKEEPKTFNNFFEELNDMCFNKIISADNTPASQQLKQDTKELVDNCIKALEGVGKDAEIVVNENGGKQSKTPMALHLFDPTVLQGLFYVGVGECQSFIDAAIYEIASYMSGEEENVALYEAMNILEPNRYQQLVRIGKVLQEGVDRYEPNNWRLIPQEAHLNHALIHLTAAGLGDTQDNHLDHALCRIMMAIATKPSKDFSYTKYIKKAS